MGKTFVREDTKNAEYAPEAVLQRALGAVYGVGAAPQSALGAINGVGAALAAHSAQKASTPHGRREEPWAAAETPRRPHPYRSVAYMTALIECRRFSASSKTRLCGPSKTSSVTSSSARPNFW